MRVVAIRNALQDLVRVGDPIVPDIVALLDSGFERRYVEGKPMLQHVKGYAGLRMVLLDALREIGTPAAKKSLLEAVGRSRNVCDFRDLLVPYLSSTDPVLVEGISALVPDMLRRLGEVGIASDDYEAQEVATYLAFWIRRRGLSGAMEQVEELLLQPVADPEARFAYDRLLSVLVEYAPEKAAHVVLTIEEENPGQGLLLWFSREINDYTVPRAQLARYYGLLLSRKDVTTSVRSGLYGGMPDHPLKAIEDPAKRAEDAQALVALLEARLAVEAGENTRYIIQEKLRRLRKDTEMTRR